MLLRRLVWLAFAVAFVAGTVQFVVQQWQAMSIIVAAESLEEQKEGSGDQKAHQPSGSAHEHRQPAEAEWRPRAGLERAAWAWVANVMMAFGLALLFLCVLAFWTTFHGVSLHPQRLAWAVGAAGFISLYLWPTLGLPAEIPGMDAARLGSRQGWWLLAAGSAGIACLIVAASRRSSRWPLAILVLAVPYLFKPPELSGPLSAGFSPESTLRLQELARQFSIASATAAVIQWCILTALCGWAFHRAILPLLLGGLLSTRVADGQAS